MKAVDQSIDGSQAVFFRDIRQVSIACGCCRTGMTEQGLNMTKAQPSFKKMRGKAVAKGVYMDFFLIPHSSTTVFMAFCAPPLSIWVVAFWIVLRLPFALGNIKYG